MVLDILNPGDPWPQYLLTLGLVTLWASLQYEEHCNQPLDGSLLRHSIAFPIHQILFWD